MSQPTKGVTPLEVNSENEAKTTMDFLKTSLESKNDWAQRQEALSLATQYFVGGIHFYAAGNPVPLVTTIKKLLSDGAKLILCSHLGKPKTVDKKFSLEPVANKLSEVLNQKIYGRFS